MFVLEVMGRHAGWIAAATGLIQSKAGDPPMSLFYPRSPSKRARLSNQQSVKRSALRRRCLRGAQTSDGRFLAESGGTDAFGHAQLGGVAPCLVDIIKARLILKCHWALADYLQRAARHIASKTDVEQAAVGASAVDAALAGIMRKWWLSSGYPRALIAGKRS